MNDDQTGELLFYTNGRLLMNRLGELMMNGDSFPPNLVTLSAYAPWAGHDFYNHGFILPDLNNTNIYNYYYIDYLTQFGGEYWLDAHTTSLYASKIDISKKNGLGEVVEKNIPILLRDSTKGYTSFWPIRHANGRDWWFVSTLAGSNTYIRLLLSPDKLDFNFPEINMPGPVHDAEAWIRSVSKDGTKIALASRTGCWVYDFDRCTGQMSNPIEITSSVSDPINNNFTFIYSIAFSDNNRYLFLTNSELNKPILDRNSVLRFDLWASTPKMTIDTIFSMDQASDLANYYLVIENLFYLPTGQLGYCGQSWKRFHVMPYTDSTSIILDTNFVNWDYDPTIFRMNRNNSSPNYYLGPIDGSSCDTLGINNNPLAYWRYDRRPNPLEIKFVDLTYYEPMGLWGRAIKFIAAPLTSFCASRHL